MRAALYDVFGDVDVLEVREVPDPTPGPGEVLIEIGATSVNHLDVLQRRGPGLLPGFSLPHIAGMDVMGTVVAVGEGCAPIDMGTRVLVDPALTCGDCEQCRAGRDGFCGSTRVVGASAPGGYAELCAVPRVNVYPVPDLVTDVEAATIPTVYSTAWLGLVVTGGLQSDDTVLVHGAGSGVTSAAVQIAKRRGARIVVTGRSAAKLEHALKLGADEVIDSTKSDIPAQVRALTGGRGADLVFDHVGPALFQPSLLALGTEGRMAFCGTTTGGSAEFDLGHAYHMGISLLGVRPYHHADFALMLDEVLGAGFASIVDTEMSLDEVGEAHRRVEAGTVAGKLVLVP
jgi:NADPH:quinone reductase-like Zn-dependent oxidoreductase